MGEQSKKGSRRGVLLVVVLLVVLTAVVVAVILSRGPDNGASGERTATILRLRWLTQSQFAGVYWAKEKGIFDKEGLDVTINPGGPGINFMQIVGSGSEEFGICSAPQIIEARAKGVPVVALATIFQGNPIIFFSKKESGITKPSQWAGKKVAVYYGYAQENVYRALLKKVGVDPKQVDEYPAKFDMTPFFRDEVDVWSGYVINQPNTAEEKGFAINRIFPDDHGVHMSGDTLFTTEDVIKEKPNVVRSMVRAILEGWREALADQEGAINIVLGMDTKLNRVHETKMIKWVAKLTLTEEIDGKIGSMTTEQWQDMVDLWREFGGITADIKPTECFDSSFVEEFYKAK